jgi:hypothetical protein
MEDPAFYVTENFTINGKAYKYSLLPDLIKPLVQEYQAVYQKRKNAKEKLNLYENKTQELENQIENIILNNNYYEYIT